MASLRDYFGSKCPHCARDILQQMPSNNRMQPEDAAWCPSCTTRFSLDDLRRGRGGGGWLKRLFGGGSHPQQG